MFQEYVKCALRLERNAKQILPNITHKNATLIVTLCACAFYLRARGTAASSSGRPDM